MLETWELIRHISEVIGMVFIPMLAWILITLTQHAKKLVLLEERVNETINTRLNTLEKHINDVHVKVERTNESLNNMSIIVNGCRLAIEEKDRKLDLILDKLKNLP